MSEAELSLWRKDTESLIEDCSGAIVDDFKDNEAFIVLPDCSKGSEYLV